LLPIGLPSFDAEDEVGVFVASAALIDRFKFAMRFTSFPLAADLGGPRLYGMKYTSRLSWGNNPTIASAHCDISDSRTLKYEIEFISQYKHEPFGSYT
jgi:hypothetical protein